MKAIMKVPNFTDLYKMYRYIARSVFGDEHSEYRISQVFKQTNVLYQVYYQGVLIHSFSHLTDVFSYLYLHNINRSQVYLDL